MNAHRILLLVLLTAFAGRALTLENSELTDPTEARYSAVAQQMVLANDWVTPKLPMPTGVEPYLGKPPLHFWLTAICYSLFGIDEWTSRLPSLVAAAVILWALWLMLHVTWKFESISVALVVAMTTPFIFIYAGACVVDMTLTAAVTAMVACCYRFLTDAEGKSFFVYGAIFAMAAGFMIKGPVAVVLSLAPVAAFCMVRPARARLATVPWLGATSLFLLLAAPWFIVAESRTPGFTRYFFWNENIARYLFREYGDRYGTGHLHMRGYVWFIFALGTLPWSPILVYRAWSAGIRQIRLQVRTDGALLMGLLLTLSPLLFFTFVRQMHPGYVLPAIPGFAVLAGSLLAGYSTLRLRWLSGAITIVTCIAMCVAVMSEYTTTAMLSAIVPIGVMIALERHWKTSPITVQQLATSLILAYAALLFAFAPVIGLSSAAPILEDLQRHVGTRPVIVGVMTENTFSHYWLSQAGSHELAANFEMRYSAAEVERSSELDYLLVGKGSRPSAEKLGTFIPGTRIGDWQWFERRPVPAAHDDGVSALLE